jgi:serine/threonine-protein kinase
MDNLDSTHLDPSAPVPRSPADLLHELRSLGDYRVLRRLGEGGMGSVYLGYHEGERRHVAIKVLGDHLASSQTNLDRFKREASNSTLLNHPNIVRGLAVGQDKATGKHYLVMEYVDGPSAHALLERVGRLSVGDAVHIILDIARALEYAHSHSFVHRDIKPDNILTTRSGVAKLSDLGLAKRTDEASNLTAHRQGFGTSFYMPYEQALNARSVDGRSDIYALGATLYHLVTGQVPFSGDNHLEVVEKKKGGEYVRASALNPAVPRLLDQILGRMLAALPGDRYQTASELIVDLERSGLAASLPSFADLEQAVQDPYVRACMAASAQPTRPDLEPVPRPLVPAVGADVVPQPQVDANGNGEVWYLRRRDRSGNWSKGRMTTPEILRRLRLGRMPAGVEASPAAGGDFRPLAEYPPFRDVKPARSKSRKASRPSARRVDSEPAAVPQAARTPADEAGLSLRTPWLWLLGAAVGLGLVATGLIVWLFILARK